MKLLYLCDRPLGLRCLKELKGEEVIVVSRNDGKEWWGVSPFQCYCRFHHPWYPDTVLLPDIVATEKPDLILSVLWRKIVPAEIVRSIPCVNLHCAPLPEYRGFNGTMHAILNGEAIFGPTLHVMAPEPDRGDIIDQDLFPIPEGITNEGLYQITHERAFQMFLRNKAALLGGSWTAYPQREGGRYYGKNDLPPREMHRDWPEEQIDRYVRAFWMPPFEPAYFTVEGRKVRCQPDTV